jgi:hypothetical protein
VFNRNHYTYLARSLKAAKPTGSFDQDVWLRAVHTIAHDLGEDNIRFDKPRFFRDCGKEIKK